MALHVTTKESVSKRLRLLPVGTLGMSSKIIYRVTLGLLLTAFLALVVRVGTSPNKSLYDEPAYGNYVALLHHYGLTEAFLISLTGSAGPLYGFVHIAFEPLTRLNPVRMRFVNVFMLIAVAAVLAVWSRLQNSRDYLLAGCSVLVVPMTWVIGGMALTELPAILFVTVSLCLQLQGLKAMESGGGTVGFFFASGVCLGIAVWGRQPYLVLMAVPVVLAILERRLRVAAAVHVVAVCAMVVPIFLIWGGVMPPLAQLVPDATGISVTHGLISLGYAGVCFLLLAPGIVRRPPRLLFGLIALTFAANALLRGFALYPVRSMVSRYLPGPIASVYGNLCGSIILSCGVLFLMFVLRTTWKSRDDLKSVTINLGLLCVTASPMLVAFQYSSRYTAMALPYLILASGDWRQSKLSTLAAALLGCGVGYFSLSGYFVR